MTSTSTASKQLIGRYLQALSGQTKTTELVKRFIDDPALEAHIHEVEKAFPAYELVAEDLIADGDRVAVRGVFHGLHQGTFAGLAPTGLSVSAPLMIVYRVHDSRIVQHWLYFDSAGLVARLRQAAPAGT